MSLQIIEQFYQSNGKINNLTKLSDQVKQKLVKLSYLSIKNNIRNDLSLLTLKTINHLGLSNLNFITDKNKVRNILSQNDNFLKLLTEKELSVRIPKPYTKKHYIDIETNSSVNDLKNLKDIVNSVNKIINKIGLNTISSIWPETIYIIISKIEGEFGVEGYCRGNDVIIINENAINEKTLLHELCHIFQRNVDQRILKKDNNYTDLTSKEVKAFDQMLLKYFKNNPNVIELHNPDALTLMKNNNNDVSIPVYLSDYGSQNPRGIRILISSLKSSIKPELIPYSEDKIHPLESQALDFDKDPKSILSIFNDLRYNDIMN